MKTAGYAAARLLPSYVFKVFGLSMLRIAEVFGKPVDEVFRRG